MTYVFIALAGIAAGFFTTLLFLKIKRRIRTGINREKGKQNGEKISFTKAVLSHVLLTYFFGLAVGAYVTLKDYSQFGILATYIATPTTTVIALYCWKSKAENMIKLKKYFSEETKDISIDLNNISS